MGNLSLKKIENSSKMKSLIFVCLLTYTLTQQPSCPCETSLNKLEKDAADAYNSMDVSKAMALPVDLRDVADQCLPKSWEDVDKCPCLKAWKDLALDAKDAAQKMDLAKLIGLVGEYQNAMKACGVNNVEELREKLMKRDVARFLRKY